MKIFAAKLLAFGGACAALIGGGTVASAQDYGHRGWDRGPGMHGRPMDSQRQLDMLHAIYANAVDRGDYRAAARAHERAEAIRERRSDRRWEHRQFGHDPYRGF